MSTVDGHRERLERLLDVAVYAPIGLAITAREHLPELVSTGRQRVEQRVTLARFIGQMVVEQGRKEIERRLSPTTPTTPSTPESPAPPAAPAARSTEPGASGDQPTAATPAPVSAPSPEALAISDYQSLAASQVVARLADLTPSELDAVERFERAHRNRRTVLGRIAQLRAGA